MQRLSGVNLSQVKLDSALTKKVLELKQQIMEKVEFSHGRNDSLNAMFEFIDMMNKIVKGYDKIKDLNQEIAKNNKDYLTKKAEFDSVNIFVEGIKWKLFQCKKTSDALNKVNFLVISSRPF